MADKPASPHPFADVLARVHAICAVLATEDNWPDGIDFSRVVVESPREASHGDMATNAAMVLAKEAKAKPRDLAEKIAVKLRADELVASVEVAGPGFINLTLKPNVWSDALRAVQGGAVDQRAEVAGRPRRDLQAVDAEEAALRVTLHEAAPDLRGHQYEGCAYHRHRHQRREIFRAH